MKVASSTMDQLDGKDMNIAIILSRFNDSIGNRLHNNVVDELQNLNVDESDIRAVRVPGALELPLAAQELAKTRKYDAIIALGVVIRGETFHFELVCQESHRGLMDVSLKTKTPVIFGVITAENEQQAVARAEADQMNKGKEYARAAIEMALLMKQLRSNENDVE